MASVPGSPASSIHTFSRAVSRAGSLRDEPISPRSYHSVPSVPHEPILNEDPFSNQVSRQLFEAIDELRRAGAGQELDLPQLVIVGKQSAGKSSLLQGLTDIPFPVGGRLCTRFATRIISKRSPPGSTDSIHISLEDGDVDNFGYSDNGCRPENFEPRTVASMTAEVFEDIIEEAAGFMGITFGKTHAPRHFSSMVLKIEISGPQRSHFGILDLPGIFSAATNRITAQEMEGVRSMVASYMRQPENIMICVADATDDLANQHIFTMAAELVQPVNLVGVLAKCDRTQHPEAIVQLVIDQESIAGRPLHHGWFVVRNAGPEESSAFDRKTEETSLFNQSPWNSIPESRRGTGQLKNFLANLLCGRIRGAFPDMQNTVSEKLRIEHERLRNLGNPRPKLIHQQTHLIEVARNFNNIATVALKAPSELDSNHLKLRGMLQRANREFAEDMKENGHLYPFCEIEQLESQQRPRRRQRRPRETTGGLDDLTESVTTSFSNLHLSTQQYELPPTPETTPSRKSGSLRRVVATRPNTKTLQDEIREQIKANQGEELIGMINPAVLKSLMRTQSSKWEELARAHFLKVFNLVVQVGDLMIDRACSESAASDRTKLGLAEMITEFGTKLEDLALREISKVCSVNANCILQTNNPQFLENVKASRLLRFKAALQRYAELRGAMAGLDDASVSAPQSDVEMGLLFEQIHPSCAQNTENEIHDVLKAYYDVAREDFIQYITQHVVEPFLWNKEGPLMGLSTEFILNLPTERIEELGGEEESVIISRQETSEKIRKLEAASRIARDTLRKTRVAVGESS
ncbi:vacuolar sorting protein VPS1 [Phlyctema vagabunda]|uniref:Vacuolar sorting protein VPS1 n=1 Tax=Phlyctema vagabunda TaxID=108571 RepID=A0ABR4PLA6_9HELO